MPTYGLKISKEGYDVKTATVEQLAFSSQFNYLKIGVSGTTDITCNTLEGDRYWGYGDITHNMGYKPARLSFHRATSPVEDYYRPEDRSEAGLGMLLAAKADTTKLYFKCYGGASAGVVVRVAYFVFRNPVDDTATGGAISGDYGLKVARLGYSVSDAPEKMAFHSGMPMLQIKLWGKHTIYQPATGATPVETEYSIPHNFGYYPAFLVFSVKRGSLWGMTPGRCPNPYGDLFDTYARITTSNLILGVWSKQEREAYVDFKYYVFTNKLE